VAAAYAASVARSAPPTELIDSVPWLRKASTPETVQDRRPEPQAGRHPEQRPPQHVEPQLGDHDGQTVMRSSLPQPELPQEELAVPAQPEPPSSDARPATGPMVLARTCGQGHANPPTTAACTVCGQALSGDAHQVRRPSLGTMVVSTGERIELDRNLIVGRQPSVSRVQGNDMPRLVQVRSENGDISRSHLEVRLEGWHVTLRDLRATNGTVLIREGQLPRRLGQGETAILLTGDTADLGDGIALRFEDLP